MPEIICFEVTNRCNLDCLHCNKIINTRPVKDISIELVDRVLTEAKPFNPRELLARLKQHIEAAQHGDGMV